MVTSQDVLLHCHVYGVNLIVPRQIYENLISSTVSVALPSLEGESRDSLSGKVADLQSGKVQIYPSFGVFIQLNHFQQIK